MTYTKGRDLTDGKPNPDDVQLFTEHEPVLPLEFPMVVLVNGETASSAEIVTGALQYHKRAIIIGEKTFGKGSVQTIIPLKRPAQTALRLTTALYYTPADVTIDHQGILPDIEAAMPEEDVRALINQLYRTFEKDPTQKNLQNHGTVTGHLVSAVDETANAEEEALLTQVSSFYGEDVAKTLRESISLKERTDKTVDDLPLLKAVEVIKESGDWKATFDKYHRDVKETQIAASEDLSKPEPGSLAEIYQLDQPVAAPAP